MSLAGLRFVWLATRRHRLRPWRSPYLRWRMETYSGMDADAITAGKFCSFALRQPAELWRFLGWCGEMSRYRRQSRHAALSAQAGPAESAPEPR